MIWLVLLAVLAIIGIVGAGLGARHAVRRVARHHEENNQVVPGVTTAAPTSWLGSHEPEAKLHRRLIAAVRAMHAGQQFDLVGAHLDLRIEIEEQVIALDNELVVTSNLPVHLREEPLGRLTESVAVIEEAVAEINSAVASSDTDELEALLGRIRDRTSTLDRARAALREIEERSEDAEEPSTSAEASATGGDASDGDATESSPAREESAEGDASGEAAGDPEPGGDPV